MTDFSQSSPGGDEGVLQPLSPSRAGGANSPLAPTHAQAGPAPLVEVPASGTILTAQGIGSAWDLPTKRTVVVILLATVVALIWISRQVIPLLVISGIIAYIMSPTVDLLERVRIPRAVSTIAVYLLLLVGLIVVPILVAPILVVQLASLSFDVPNTAYGLWEWFIGAITNLPNRLEILGFEVPIDGLTQQIESGASEFTFIPTLAEFLGYIQQLISTATNVMSSTAAIGFSVVGGIFNALIAVLVVFFLSLYLTKDAPTIRAYVESLFPQSYQSEWVDLLRRMGYIWQAFFRGQILLCVIIGVTTGLALHLAGMPGALVLGLLAAVLEVIPNIGPIIAMIPAVIIALIQGSSVLSEYGVGNLGFALITVAIYFVIQQLEAYILVPRIIGGNVRLHPVVIVAGVAIGYNVAGIAGAFFAAPVIATCRVLGGYIHAKLLDYPPFFNQPLPLRRRRRPFSYRRTVTGDELAAHEKPPAPTDGSPLTVSARTAGLTDAPLDGAVLVDSESETTQASSTDTSPTDISPTDTKPAESRSAATKSADVAASGNNGIADNHADNHADNRADNHAGRSESMPAKQNGLADRPAD